MLSGKVKFFNEDKGYGFIARDDGQGDVFCHVSDVQRSGLDELREGDTVSFDTQPSKNGKGPRAVNLKIAA